jgi:hypothetical protein
MSKKVITLYELTSQQEIFCNFYLKLFNASVSAYEAGYFSFKEKCKYEELTRADKTKLTKRANELLKDKKIKKKIEDLADKAAQDKNILSLDDTLEYLSLVIRQAKKKITSTFYTNCGLRAAELMIKHYQDAGQNNQDEPIQFSRFSK